MKTGLIALFCFWLACLSPARAQVSFGQPESINSTWKFTLKDVENGQDVQLDDSRWQAVDLPHDWSVRGQLSPNLASATGYLPGGIGWYRKHLTVPADKKGRRFTSILKAFTIAVKYL